jgi:hypothetical protein
VSGYEYVLDPSSGALVRIVERAHRAPVVERAPVCRADYCGEPPTVEGRCSTHHAAHRAATVAALLAEVSHARIQAKAWERIGEEADVVAIVHDALGRPRDAAASRRKATKAGRQVAAWGRVADHAQEQIDALGGTP